MHAAVLVQTPEEERKRLLSFVVCGGGPTGVEVAAEMHDMIFDDLKVRIAGRPAQFGALLQTPC
jgi:NADH dehydrogenase FAD-containing subunit